MQKPPAELPGHRGCHELTGEDTSATADCLSLNPENPRGPHGYIVRSSSFSDL